MCFLSDDVFDVFSVFNVYSKCQVSMVDEIKQAEVLRLATRSYIHVCPQSRSPQSRVAPAGLTAARSYDWRSRVVVYQSRVSMTKSCWVLRGSESY